jgi:GT2 family glycosyltransferase/lipopolysaccharide/colanic/teichoic acid biosynthesis glycosyltransferase
MIRDAMNGKSGSTPLEVSVIIVNYNVRDFLHQSLVSLQKALRGIRSEIIVADNASDDDSSGMVRQRFPHVRLIQNSTNLGFAKANNIALRRARGRLLLLINPDTIVQEDTIKMMLRFFKTHPECGLAGCKILNPDGSFQPSCRRGFPTPWVALAKMFGLSRLFPTTKLFGKYNLTYLSVDETYAVDAVSGSFMMARKEAVKQVGGLDEDFFMYGEDIDWCYRFRRAGWQVYYVHSTQIIHYKGESTKRSDLDEIKTFYRAMHLFVEKHFRYQSFFSFLLRLSIALVSSAAFLTSLLRPLKVAVIDYVCVIASLLLAEYTRRGTILQYPSYAYPIIFIIPAVIVIAALYAAGVYTRRRMSISRSIVAVMSGYVIISALTAFFKSYAFSRWIVGISGILCLVLIPGWRLILRLKGKAAIHGRGTLSAKRTLIVGTGRDAQELLKKLRTTVGKGYDIVGFIGNTHKQIGRTIHDIPIVGTLDNVGKMIKEEKISDVIFAPHAFSYKQILSVIGKSREWTVNFHLVPTTMEVMVGKATVDTLDDLPLVQIAYNISKPSHQLAKRAFDVALSGLLLATVYPIFRLSAGAMAEKENGFLSRLPSVLKGTMSFVGPPVRESNLSNQNGGPLFLGKPGLSGLVQLQRERRLAEKEIDQYNLYYARNQSILLDIEILFKTWQQRGAERVLLKSKR